MVIAWLYWLTISLLILLHCINLHVIKNAHCGYKNNGHHGL